MYCDAPASQVIDPQHTAYDISTEVVEDEDLPYRLAVCVEDRGRLRYQSVCCRRLMLKLGRILRDVVEVEYPLDRCYNRSGLCDRLQASTALTYLAVSQGLV